MKHPKPEKCYQLADTFLFLHLSTPEAKVFMMDPRFNVCRTIACNAGWFAVSMGRNESIGFDFLHSADIMAKFLGFSGREDLKEWTGGNTELWGNKFGRDMFSFSRAFLKHGEKIRKITLLDISNHWREVGERIEALK